MHTMFSRTQRRSLIILLAIVVLSSYWSFASADSAKTGNQANSQISRIRHQTQQALDAWAAEEQKLATEIAELEHELKRIRWEREKTESYRKTIVANLAVMQNAKDEEGNIATNLLPYLDSRLKELADRIKLDLPFERNKRLHQLAGVKQILNDPDADLATKTRSFLVALENEVELGHRVAIAESEIRVEDNLVRVKLLRVGRLGLYALGPDGRQAYQFHTQSTNFQAAPHAAQVIRRAIAIVEHRRLAHLVPLPLSSTGE